MDLPTDVQMVIRPAVQKEAKQYLLKMRALSLAVLCLVVLTDRHRTLPALLIPLVIGAGVGLALRIVFKRRMRIELRTDTLLYTGYGRPKVLARRHGSGVAIVRTTQPLGLTTDRWIFYPDGKKPIRPLIVGAAWDLAQVNQAREALNVPVYVEQQVLSLEQMRVRYPGSIQWVIANPVPAAAAIFVGTLGITVALAITVSVLAR